MLSSLSVENYALIDKTEVEWDKGFSVITGETGSGKSILLGALALIQGVRADMKVLRDSERKCVVEAEFEIKDYSLQPFFEQNELDYEDVCVIRREIASTGKSRAFINDTPVALSQLKELSNYLIDIHSQHETLLLNEDLFQLQLLDSLIDIKSLLNDYQSHYRAYMQLQKEFEALKIKIEEDNSNRDYIEFQLKQLHEAAFHEGEQEEIEQEMLYLSHASELKTALEKTLWFMSEKEEDICSSLKDVCGALSGVDSVYEDIRPVRERAESCLIELKDISRELELRLSEVSVDPQRLEVLTSRLDLLYSLQKKHKVENLSSLLKLQESFENQLSQLDSSDELLMKLEKEIEKEESSLSDLSASISDKRHAGSQLLESRVEAILKNLGMQNAKMEVRIVALNNFTLYGKDSVKFYFSANKNASLQPISAVASGGELSRVMLALKSILSQSKKMPTIILDEIDTGVSGEVADRMADLMKSMGHYMQVISITHLPQIAAKGDIHYKVYKEDNEKSTVSHIVKLSSQERVDEIAQMLSGATPSKAAVENAKVLLGL